MADNIWDDDEDDDTPVAANDTDLVKQLRKLVRDEKAKSKTYEEELKTLRPTVRKQTVSQVLAKLNVNPKIAGLVPSDVEATDDGIKAWVDEYGDLFGATTNDANTGNQADTEPDTNDGATSVDADQAAQWQRIQSQASQSGTTTPDQDTAQLAMLQAAAKAANGDSDKYFSYLRGEVPLPQ
jgi:hypothetical protein